MKIKKNVFSYICWFIFTFLLLTGIMQKMFSDCISYGYAKNWGYLLSLGAILVPAVLVLLFLFIESRIPSNIFSEHTVLQNVLQWIVLLIVFLFGVMVRIQALPVEPSYNFNYEISRIRSDVEYAPPVHGATYLYVQLLRLLFFFTGNKYQAGIVLQIVLFCLMTFLICLILKKFYGFTGALTTLCLMLFSEKAVLYSITYSPQVLFYIFFFVLLALGMYLSDKTSNAAWLIYGSLCGIVTYLDVHGILLLVFGGILCVKYLFHERHDKQWMRFVYLLLSFLVSFVTVLSIDAYISNGTVLGIWKAYTKLYQPGVFRFPTAIAEYMNPYEYLVLLIILMMGCLSMFRKTNYSLLTLWYFLFAFVLLMDCFQMTSAYIPGENGMIYLLWFICGVGMAECTCCDRNTVQATAVPAEEAAVLPAIPEVEINNLETRTVEFIENPLPLPKRHEKRIMDFDIDVSDDDDFDI